MQKTVDQIIFGTDLEGFKRMNAALLAKRIDASQLWRRYSPTIVQVNPIEVKPYKKVYHIRRTKPYANSPVWNDELGNGKIKYIDREGEEACVVFYNGKKMKFYSLDDFFNCKTLGGRTIWVLDNKED